MYSFRTREKIDCRLFGDDRRFPRKRAPSCGQLDELTEKKSKNHTSCVFPGLGPTPGEQDALGQVWALRPVRVSAPMGSHVQPGLIATHQELVPMTTWPVTTQSWAYS